MHTCTLNCMKSFDREILDKKELKNIYTTANKNTTT